MAETTAAKSLSALVYSSAQSKALFKTHGGKKKITEAVGCSEALEKYLRFLNGAVSREELYHELNKHSPWVKNKPDHTG